MENNKSLKFIKKKNMNKENSKLFHSLMISSFVYLIPLLSYLTIATGISLILLKISFCFCGIGLILFAFSFPSAELCWKYINKKNKISKKRKRDKGWFSCQENFWNKITVILNYIALSFIIISLILLLIGVIL